VTDSIATNAQAASSSAAEEAEPIVPARKALPGSWRAALAIFFLIAAVSRFSDLGSRPFHHDESIHAYQSNTLARDGTWRYDPAYHGPFLYYANALVYKIFGTTNTTARLLPALFGLILIGLAWPLARWIGKPAALLFAVLVLVSPHFTYFSRFIREDIYSLVFTFGTILAFRAFLETDRARWLTTAAVFFALAGLTKETVYMTAIVFLVFGAWIFLERALADPKPAAGLSKTFAGTYRWVRERWGPFFTAGLVFLVLWALGYSALGRYPQDWLAIPKAVRYWMGQHSIARIPGPWYYYVPQLLYYETATLLAALLLARRRDLRGDPLVRSVVVGTAGLTLAALTPELLGWGRTGKNLALLFVLGGVVGAIAALRLFHPRRGEAPPFLRFVVYWTFASLAIFSWAREKVPWLTVHSLLPLTILAAVALADLWADRARRQARISLAAVILLLAINASAMLLACFRYGAYDVAREPKHGEYLAYVQTTWDLVRALKDVEVASHRVPAGQPAVTVMGESTWPLSWYLRDVTVKWTGRLEAAETPVVIADWSSEGGLDKQLQDRYRATRVPIRAWWFPDDFFKRGFSEKLRWWLFHELWSQIGSQDCVFYVRKDLGGSTPLEPLRVPIQDTGIREFHEEAAAIPALRSLVSGGSSPAQFAEPRGLAADGRGNLYVADTKNSRIQVFDSNGQFLRQFGTKGPGPGQFNEPCGIAVDPQGDLWIADTWNQRIVHMSADNRFLSAIGGEENGFFGPRAVLVSRGSVYVADTGNKKIVRFDPQGRRLFEWGGAGIGPGQFVEPVGLAADAAGNVYVADTGNHRIQIFDADGKFLRQLPVFGWKDFYTEPYLAIGPSDSIFATDSSTGRIVQYDSSGALKRTWKADGEFKLPTGIAIDSFGRLSVSDRGTHRIFVWSLENVLK